MGERGGGEREGERERGERGERGGEGKREGGEREHL